MEQTAIQSEVPFPKAGQPVAGLNGSSDGMTNPTARPQSELKGIAWLILQRMASLRITVTLFVLSMLLVFWGTLAQVDSGIQTVVNTYFRCFLAWIPLKVIFFNAIDNRVDAIPFPGGLTIGGVMLVNLLAAHAVRFRLAWARSGIIVIHVGIIVMMLSEVVTYLYADEGQIILPVGQTVNHVVHVRQAELAVIRHIDEKNDDVVVVPSTMLQTGAKVHDSRLPFDLEVVEYMVNSSWLEVEPNGKNPANRGLGLRERVRSIPEVSGVDPNQKVDVPSAYIRLSRDGTSLGTWLFSGWFSENYGNLVQEITVDGKTYQVVLRYKQTNRDFYIHLTDFKQENHPGTEKPKDYRSFIRLIDQNAGVDKNVEIYMNAPMTYRGETFYQQGVDTDRRTNVTISTLQVVRNPGWMLPYISCAVVGLGLLFHFGITLYRFLDRRVAR